jgi:hypothetical protein
MVVTNSEMNKKTNKMKLHIIIIVSFFVFINTLTAQEKDVRTQLNDIFVRIDPAINKDSAIKEAIKEVYKFNVHDNDLVFKALQQLINEGDKKFSFLRDMNLSPKVFQTESNGASLGFQYKYDNSWTKQKKTKNSLFIQDYSIALNGNVAFTKVLNPNSFLESTVSYNGAFNWGGKPLEIDDETTNKIEALEDTIIARRSRKEPYLDLYRQVSSFIRVSDQFYIGAKGKFAFESNQDFSKSQFVPGIIIGAGAKGWDENEALRYFNILDYPFALIRLLTGTDDHFNVYGATFPSFLFGWDYVIPQKDTLRKSFTGNENGFNRIRFEVSFKTRVARIGNEVFNFSSNYRWYNEVNASQEIKNNGLAFSNFFVAAIESNSGLFVSYTTGRLPFDKKNDQVYAIGFKYDLGNSKK